MAEEKVLYIGFKRQDGILIGGGLANKRCINTLHRRFGEQNVHEYYLLDDLPKSSTGKIQKNRLREIYDATPKKK